MSFWTKKTGSLFCTLFPIQRLSGTNPSTPGMYPGGLATVPFLPKDSVPSERNQPTPLPTLTRTGPEIMFTNILWGLFPPLDTTPLSGASFWAGASNTNNGGLRPERTADFFAPRFFLPPVLSAFLCRACDEYKTLRGNQSAVPLTVTSARRPFRASPHRLVIDQRRST